MEQLIYISTSRNPSQISAVELENILAVSRANNARDGLTGLLVTGGRRFLQLLEGPAAPLSAAYERILADPRHFAMVQLSRRSIARRSFPDWQMGYDPHGDGLGKVVDELLGSVTDPALRAEFRGFAERHDARV